MRRSHLHACLRRVSHPHAEDICLFVSLREFDEGAIGRGKRPLAPDITFGIM